MFHAVFRGVDFELAEFVMAVAYSLEEILRPSGFAGIEHDEGCTTVSQSTSVKLPWHLNSTNWFILAGIIGTCVFGWFAAGQPGVPLKDGDYGCSAQNGAIPGPGATVVNGRVVDAWDFDSSTGATPSVPFRNPERKNPGMFTMTSVGPGGHRYEFECTY